MSTSGTESKKLKRRNSNVRFADASPTTGKPSGGARPGSASSVVSEGEFHIDIGDDEDDFFASGSPPKTSAVASPLRGSQNPGVTQNHGQYEFGMGDFESESKPLSPPSSSQIASKKVTQDVKPEASFGDALEMSTRSMSDDGKADKKEDLKGKGSATGSGDAPFGASYDDKDFVPQFDESATNNVAEEENQEEEEKKKRQAEDELMVAAGVEGQSNVAFVHKFFKFYKVERYYQPFPANPLTDFVTRFPSLVLAVFLVIPFIFLILAIFRPAKFDTSPTQFFNSRHPLFRAEAAVEAAAAEWNSERMHGTYDGRARTFPKYRYILQFTPTGTNGTVWEFSNTSSGGYNNRSGTQVMNMLQEESLRYVQQVELMIANSYAYPVLCWTNNRKYSVQQHSYPQCVPMASVTSYFFPGGIGASASGYVDMQLSGKGDNYQRPEERVIRTIRQSQMWPWFFDAQMSNDETVFASSVLRTQFTIGWPMIRNGVPVTIEEFNLIVDAFLQQLVANISALGHPDIEVTLTGDRLIEAHASEFVFTQIQLTAVAVVMVYMCLTIYLRSVIMPAAACSSIVLTFLTSYYIYTWNGDSTELSLMAALSLLVTLGLNVNGILVTWETWAESGNLGTTGRLGNKCMNQRVGYMYARAVLPNVLSRVLGICAFAFLTLTPVPALRGFAVIMMISFSIDTYMFTLVFPPALIFYQVHFSARRNNVQRETGLLKPPVKGGKKRQRHPGMRRHLKAEEAIKRMYGESTYSESRQRVFEEEGTFEEELDGLHKGQERSMSMSNLARSKSFITEQKEDKPKRTTYTQGRMARLVSVAQIAKDLTDRLKARPMIDGALASYARRLGAKKDDAEISEEDLLPRPFLDENGNVGGCAPDSILIQFRDKWEFIARFIGTMRSDEYSAGISEFTTDTVMCKNMLSHGEVAGKDYKPVDPAPPFPKTTAFFEATMEPFMFETWRPAETRDEKDADYLNKFTNHLGINYWPWWFRKRFVSFIFPLRYIATAVFFVLFWVSVSLGATITASNESVNVLRVLPEPMIRYPAYADNFPVQSWCDYCSGYQQKRTTFPILQVLATQQCSAQGFGLQMHATVDRCGTCMGNNSCLDCEARPFGAASIDACGDCRGSTDTLRDGCQDCTSGNLEGAYGCWYCNQTAGAMFYSGAGCTTKCDDTLCPPNRGTCNAWTGVCECHQSYTQGYFDNDASSSTFCTVCVSGFFPDPNTDPTSACQYECDPATASAACNCVDNRCTGCPQAYMGDQCTVENITSCFRGTLSAATQSCTCNNPTLDEEHCRYHVDCSGYHGEKYPASEGAVVSTATCACRGQWRGPLCQFCRCFNGGTCHINGTCECQPGWGGSDCNVCIETCAQHGVCPNAWEDVFYTRVDTCVAILCSQQEVDAGTVCAACSTPTVSCNQTTDKASCDSHHGSCEWTYYPDDGDNGVFTPVPPPTPYPVAAPPPVPKPYSPGFTPTPTLPDNYTSLTHSHTFQPLGYCVQRTPVLTNNECTNCKGAWTDASCASCNTNADGAHCDVDGWIIGCDGLQTAINEPVRVVDRCGVCNGDGECFGCDGVRGSDAKLDQCGICKGNNACLVDGEGDGTEVTLSWGIVPPLVYNRNGTTGQFSVDKSFDLNDVNFQLYLNSLCSNVIFTRHDLINTNRSKCVWADFAVWLNSNATQTSLATDFPNENIQFPFTGSTVYMVHRLLYVFAKQDNRFAEVAFDNPFLVKTTTIHYPVNNTPGALSGAVTTVVDTNLTAVWIKMFLYTHGGNSTTVDQKLAQYSDFKVLAAEINANPLNRGHVMISSPTWTALITERSYGSVAMWGFGMLLAIFLIFMCVLTCSPMLVLLAVASVAQCSCCTIMSFRIFGYALGPVQTASICLTGVYAADHMIHQVFDFANRLPNHSSEIVSGSWYLKSAIKCTLARAGPCILVSGISASMTALTVVFSKFQVFHEMGLAILSGNFWSLLVNLVLFPTLLCFVGPTRAYHGFWQVRLITLLTLCLLLMLVMVTMDGVGFVPDLSQGYMDIV